MTPEEIESGVQRWEKLCDDDQSRWAAMTEEEYLASDDSGNQTVYEYLGISEEEFNTWAHNRDPRIEIGIDIDTVEVQQTHVVLGVGHFDKRPLCGADTLWGYHDGTIKDVTCPNCLQRMK